WCFWLISIWTIRKHIFDEHEYDHRGTVKIEEKSSQNVSCSRRYVCLLLLSYSFAEYLTVSLMLTVELSHTEFNRAISLVIHWLCYANSAVNPIIYNFMSGKYL
ncbi:hypothetical protein YQE_12516, partial [Dendroctonus ponderosae]